MQPAQATSSGLRLMEENLIGHLSYLPGTTEGMVVRERAGCFVIDSGLPCDSFNILYCCGSPSGVDLQEAVRSFRSRQLPFAVWLGPRSNSDLALLHLGLKPTEADTG